MVDAVNLLRIGVAARERRIEDPHGEQEIGILEPFQVIRNCRLGGLVPQRFKIPREAIDGVEGGRVVYQPVCQIGHRLRMGNDSD